MSMYYIEFTTKYNKGPAVIHTEPVPDALPVIEAQEHEKVLLEAHKIFNDYEELWHKLMKYAERVTALMWGSIILNVILAAIILL